MSGQYTPPRVTTEEVNSRGHNIPRNLWGNNKALSRRQPQEAEAPWALEEESTQGMSGQYTPPRVTTEEVNSRGHCIPRNLWGNNKALSRRQPQEAEAPGASEEGLGINLGKFIAYSMVRTRAILQGCVMSPFRNKRK
jgi:hypothetical protein